jgi:hypothetical protein
MVIMFTIKNAMGVKRINLILQPLVHEAIETNNSRSSRDIWVGSLDCLFS